MKKVVVFLTIAIFIGMIAYVAYSNSNRRSSWVYLDINSTYGSAYNPPTFRAKGCFGSDSEGPLYSSGDSSVSYTDDGHSGWSRHPTWPYTTHNVAKDGPYEDKYDNYAPPGFFTGNVKYAAVLLPANFGMVPGTLGIYYSYKNYRKKFAVSADAYVSCWTDNANYKTEYNLYAQVPAGFQYPNYRKIGPITKYGSFSRSTSRSGDKDGWDHEISTNPNGQASASGTNPSDGTTHNTSAFTPTPGSANELTINCGFCDDSGCDVCNPHR